MPVMIRPSRYIGESTLTAVRIWPRAAITSDAINTGRRPRRSAISPPGMQVAARAMVEMPAARAMIEAEKCSSFDAFTSASEETSGSAT